MVVVETVGLGTTSILGIRRLLGAIISLKDYKVVWLCRLKRCLSTNTTSSSNISSMAVRWQEV
jgi:hypothetical protein